MFSIMLIGTRFIYFFVVVEDQLEVLSTKRVGIDVANRRNSFMRAFKRAAFSCTRGKNRRNEQEVTHDLSK